MWAQGLHPKPSFEFELIGSFWQFCNWHFGLPIAMYELLDSKTNNCNIMNWGCMNACFWIDL
jgi:hypothetical protein